MSNRSVALHDPSPTPNGPNAVKDRLAIVALDVSSAAEAQTLVSAIGESAHIYKVGKQLVYGRGAPSPCDLVASGRKVFSRSQIPRHSEHRRSRRRRAAKLKVSTSTVHASGGLKMLKAAAEAANSSASKPLILAVTVLTSLTDEDLTEIGFSGSVAHEALRLAGLARMAGCGGVVSSAHEAVSLRRELGTGFAIVTPGIRPMGADVGDQARIGHLVDAMRGSQPHRSWTPDHRRTQTSGSRASHPRRSPRRF